MLSFIRRNLIECAAAFIILVVLAAILFPVRPPRESRWRIQCVNNLKQIGTALAQYMQENDDTFPLLANGRRADGKEFTWRLAIQPYMEEVKVWKCPSNDASEIESAVDGLPLSYEVVDSGPIRSGKPIKLADLNIPSQTIMAFEEEAFDGNAHENGVAWDKDDGSQASLNVIFANHLGTSNFLFADGHVKSTRPILTVSKGVNMWHVDTRAKVTPRVKQKVELATRKAVR